MTIVWSTVEEAEAAIRGTPMTLAEATLHVRYQMRMHALHQRLYRRLKGFVAAVSLVAGSAAAVSAVNQNHGALLAMGILVAIASAADLVCGWSDRAAKHEMWLKKMASVLADALQPGADLTSILRALAFHEGEALDELEGLRRPAMNDVLRSNGHEEWVRKLSLWECTLQAIS